MHVQGVYGEVVGVHGQVLEHLAQRELLPAPLQHHALCLLLIRRLDELQQMFLVHAGSCVDVRVNLVEKWYTHTPACTHTCTHTHTRTHTQAHNDVREVQRISSIIHKT